MEDEAPPAAAAPDLGPYFKKCCGTKKDMDGRQFAKVFKDGKFLNKKLTSVDVDMAFAKIKSKGSRRIKYKEFLKGLTLLAPKRGWTFEQFAQKIASQGGPKFKGTKAAYNKFHDDKS